MQRWRIKVTEAVCWKLRTKSLSAMLLREQCNGIAVVWMFGCLEQGLVQVRAITGLTLNAGRGGSGTLCPLRLRVPRRIAWQNKISYPIPDQLTSIAPEHRQHDASSSSDRPHLQTIILLALLHWLSAYNRIREAVLHQLQSLTWSTPSRCPGFVL